MKLFRTILSFLVALAFVWLTMMLAGMTGKVGYIFVPYIIITAALIRLNIIKASRQR